MNPLRWFSDRRAPLSERLDALRTLYAEQGITDTTTKLPALKPRTFEAWQVRHNGKVKRSA